jgi:voltage-gated potassium channel Kch
MENNTHGDFLKDLNIQAILGQEPEAEISSDLPTRKWLYSWLLDPNLPGNYQKDVDKWIGFLIIANLFTLMFEHVPAVYEPYRMWFELFDVFSVAVFTIEYALRFYLAPEDDEFKHSSSPRGSYVISPFAIIDFLAVAPFYLKSFIPIDLRVLRFLRLLRILKLFRVIVPAIAEFQALNKGRTFRQKVHALVFPSNYGGALQEMFEVFIAIWVLLSVFAVVMESVKSVHYILNIQFVILDAVAVGIFTIEFFMRMYACVEEPGYKGAVVGRLKQFKSPSTFIDFLAIVPFFLEVILHHLFDLRFLRVFRLARLLKLTRGSDATAILFKVIAREWPILGAAAFIMVLVIVLTASLGYLFEYDAQPEKFENIPTAIYWAVITLASVGYGDISPVTPIGRAMTTMMALMGIGIFAIPAALLASAFSDELIKERESLKANLFNILKDGKITDKEAHFIRSEAKRLHLSNAELNALVDVVIKEHELEERNPLPVHKVGEKPELAVEHYKALLGQIRQLGLHTDLDKFDQAAQHGERLSSKELALWNHIQGKA